MRPRLFAAENTVVQMLGLLRIDASMRPRLFAAENGFADYYALRLDPCFNEAAALRRGKPARW